MANLTKITAAAALVLVTATGSNALATTPGSVNLAPSYSERWVPATGASRQTVLEKAGTPTRKQFGTNNAEVWDYGTFRVFFYGEKVAFTRVW